MGAIQGGGEKALSLKQFFPILSSHSLDAGAHSETLCSLRCSWEGTHNPTLLKITDFKALVLKRTFRSKNCYDHMLIFT